MPRCYNGGVRGRPSSAFRSKSGFWGLVIFLVTATNITLTQLQNIDFVGDNLGTIISSVQTGVANLVLMGFGIILILWAIFSRQQENGPSEAAPEAEFAREPEPGGAQEADSSTSLSADVARKREIRNKDFRIIDLLRLVGERDSVIEGKTFHNCTIYGPGIITFGAPPLSPEEIPEGAIGRLTVFNASTLYVEGSRESVLHETATSGAEAKGVIHLSGCSFTRVTFRNIGIAGSASELQWWRENVEFSEGNTA